jgi:L-fuculose-phosphate aldolase
MRNAAQARKDLADVAAHLSQLGFLVADSGLLSARAGDEIIVTPENLHRSRLDPRLLEAVRLDGKSKSDVRPSSDLWSHLVIYRERDDVGSVLYAQPPYATGFAAAGVPLDMQVLPEVVLKLGPVPLVQQEGPQGPMDSIRPHLGESTAFLLANRGVLTIADDPWRAAARLEMVEHFARVLFLARQLGQVKSLSDAQVARLVEARFADEGGRNR